MKWLRRLFRREPQPTFIPCRGDERCALMLGYQWCTCHVFEGDQ